MEVKARNQIDSSAFINIVRLLDDPVFIADRHGEILFANTAGLRLLCRLPGTTGSLPQAFARANREGTRVTLFDLTGNEVILKLQRDELEYESMAAFLYHARDITEQEIERRILNQLVHRDHLTGLYNRRGLEHLAQRMTCGRDTPGQCCHVLYIDINGLKQVNDTLGHQIGDELIRETAALLQATFRPADIKARIGGDEFAVILTREADTPIEHLLAQLQQAISVCNAQTGRTYVLSLSIGVARYCGEQPFDLQTLLSQADFAMYRAKSVGEQEESAPLAEGTPLKRSRLRLASLLTRRQGMSAASKSVT